MKKLKKLCDIKKLDYQKREYEIIKVIKNATFFCKKCLRVSSDKNSYAKTNYYKSISSIL